MFGYAGWMGAHCLVCRCWRGAGLHRRQDVGPCFPQKLDARHRRCFVRLSAPAAWSCNGPRGLTQIGHQGALLVTPRSRVSQAHAEWTPRSQASLWLLRMCRGGQPATLSCRWSRPPWSRTFGIQAPGALGTAPFIAGTPPPTPALGGGFCHTLQGPETFLNRVGTPTS